MQREDGGGKILITNECLARDGGGKKEARYLQNFFPQCLFLHKTQRHHRFGVSTGKRSPVVKGDQFLFSALTTAVPFLSDLFVTTEKANQLGKKSKTKGKKERLMSTHWGWAETDDEDEQQGRDTHLDESAWEDDNNPSDNEYVEDRHVANMLERLDERSNQIAELLRAQLARAQVVRPLMTRAFVDADVGDVPPIERPTNWREDGWNADLARVMAISQAEFERIKELADLKKESERKLKAQEMRHKEEIKRLTAEIERLQRQEVLRSPVTPVPAHLDVGVLTRGKRARILSETTRDIKTLPENKTNKDEERDVCCICMDRFENTERGCVQPCGHSRYHYECAMTLYEKTGTCALHSPPVAIDNVIKIKV